MGKFRFGLIGAGFIGCLHARVIAENPLAELTAVADVNRELGEKTAREYGAKYYSDYKEMLEKEHLDAADICVPEDFHTEVALGTANSKTNFIIEKPLDKTLEGAKKIVEAVDKNNVRMMVAHVCKFDPRYAQLKEAIRGGALGEISSLALKRCNPMGTTQRLKGKISFFYYLGIHDLEMLIDYNMPSKPTRVYAQASKKVNSGLGDYDSAFAIINFDNKAIACLQVGWAYPNNSAMGILCSVDVVGTKGAAMIAIENQGLQIMDADRLSYPDTLHWPEYNGKIQGDLKEEIAHFVEATLENKPYVVPTETCVYAVAVAEAALKSVESGQPVDLRI
jgi:UDP-N-acetylglucosamine 3-dehydrogenase